MPKSKATVVDIGSKSISVLIGSKGVNNTFVIHGYGESDYAGYYEGEFLEEENLKEVFSKVLFDAQSSANVCIDKLYVGVPANFSYCKTKTLTQSFGQKVKILEQDLAEIYKRADDFENHNQDSVLISCSPINFVLDDGRKTINPIGQKSTKITATVSLVYAEKTFIEKINSLLKSIGISTVEYLSSPLCESLYLLNEDRRLEGAVLIDCGYIETSVSTIKGEGLLDLKSFAVGGGHISADLMECLNISFNDAEQLRKQLVLTVEPNENDHYELNINENVYPVSMKNANEITHDRIEMIASLINRCIKNDNTMPFYLTGGGIAFIKGGKEVLSECIGKNITVLCPKDVHLAKPHYSALLGLMNKAISQEESYKGLLSNLIGKFKRK